MFLPLPGCTKTTCTPRKKKKPLLFRQPMGQCRHACPHQVPRLVLRRLAQPRGQRQARWLHRQARRHRWHHGMSVPCLAQLLWLPLHLLLPCRRPQRLPRPQAQLQPAPPGSGSPTSGSLPRCRRRHTQPGRRRRRRRCMRAGPPACRPALPRPPAPPCRTPAPRLPLAAGPAAQPHSAQAPRRACWAARAGRAVPSRPIWLLAALQRLGHPQLGRQTGAPPGRAASAAVAAWAAAARARCCPAGRCQTLPGAPAGVRRMLQHKLCKSRAATIVLVCVHELSKLPWTRRSNAGPACMPKSACMAETPDASCTDACSGMPVLVPTGLTRARRNASSRRGSEAGNSLRASSARTTSGCRRRSAYGRAPSMTASPASAHAGHCAPALRPASGSAESMQARQKLHLCMSMIRA